MRTRAPPTGLPPSPRLAIRNVLLPGTSSRPLAWLKASRARYSKKNAMICRRARQAASGGAAAASGGAGGQAHGTSRIAPPLPRAHLVIEPRMRVAQQVYVQLSKQDVVKIEHGGLRVVPGHMNRC